jgi:hypothetical protein
MVNAAAATKRSTREKGDKTTCELNMSGLAVLWS